MLNEDIQAQQERILVNVEKRIGVKITWDDLISGDIEDLGGQDTLNDLLDAGLANRDVQ